MSLLWTGVLPALVIVATAFGVGYYLGREVGREQGRTDVLRRLENLRRSSR